MLSKCANPNCSKEFHYFTEGKVFEIRPEKATNYGSQGKRRSGIEHYWLCSECASIMTLAADPEKNVRVIPRQAVARGSVKRERRAAAG